MQTFNIKIGGEAGQGLVSVGNILLRAAARKVGICSPTRTMSPAFAGATTFSRFA
jgi:Pyruvate/2-oxoacid:ferredoxin oxidoreductase gamma subunit